MKNIK